VIDKSRNEPEGVTEAGNEMGRPGVVSTTVDAVCVDSDEDTPGGFNPCAFGVMEVFVRVLNGDEGFDSESDP